MNARFALFAIAFLALSVPAFALSVDVNVAKNVSGEILENSNLSSGGIFRFGLEFFNSGSLPYSAVARLDMISSSGIEATSWSKSQSLSPGDRGSFTLYSHVNCPGNYTPRIRIYYANEIIEKYYPEQSFGNCQEPSEMNITDIAFGKDYVAFSIKSPETMNVILNGFGYLPGWKVYQDTASLSSNMAQRIKLYYSADYLANSPMKLQVFSPDGKYFAEMPITVLTEEAKAGNVIEYFLGMVSSFLKV